jgi:2-amino-4-ketopentanoate thiolase alpha subunit
MSDYAKKGDWVQIHEIILLPEERASHLPEDTKKVPLEQWVKGTINNDGSIGETVEITTVTGRKVSGRLVDINPGYVHDFGKYIPELIHIGPQLRQILKEGE